MHQQSFPEKKGEPFSSLKGPEAFSRLEAFLEKPFSRQALFKARSLFQGEKQGLGQEAGSPGERICRGKFGKSLLGISWKREILCPRATSNLELLMI